MENEGNDKKEQNLTVAALYKEFEHKKDYAGQKTSPIVEKWKSAILKKYGKGGLFYYCELDGLYYYAEKNEEFVK